MVINYAYWSIHTENITEQSEIRMLFKFPKAPRKMPLMDMASGLVIIQHLGATN